MHASRELAPYLRTLTVLAVLYTLYFAAPILIPFTLAILFAFTLAPLVRLQERLLIAPPLGAAIVLGMTLTGVVVAIGLLAEPAAEWFASAPKQIDAVERKLRTLRAPIQSVQEASEGVEKLAEDVSKNSSTVMQVRIKKPSFLGSALSGTPRAIGTIVATFFFLYFLLASGRQLTMKLTRLMPSAVREDHLTAIAHEIQTDVSRYLLTVSMINLTLGCATAIWLWWLDVANPGLWGAMVFALNFAPYVGAVVGACLLTTVALLQFDTMVTPLMVVGGYTTLSVIEGQLLTPLILGRSLALSPYVVFIGIICLGWLWGIPGALMAVPLMVCAKIVCERVPEVSWLAVLIERERGPTAKRNLGPV